MKTATDLTDYLHQHIPLSKTMGVEVSEASLQKVRLKALFEPNVNHQCTVFGGSASAVAILAAWTLVHVRLTEAGMNCDLVIQRNTIEYCTPFAEDFEAESVFEDESAWRLFSKTYQRKGKGRLMIPATLICQGEKVGNLEGAFVALRRNS